MRSAPLTTSADSSSPPLEQIVIHRDETEPVVNLDRWLIAGFFGLTAMTMAMFHFAIKLQEPWGPEAELSIAVYLGILAIGLATFPRASTRAEFWKKCGIGEAWCGASIFAVLLQSTPLFYLAFAAVFVRTARECVAQKGRSTAIATVFWSAWLFSGVVFLALAHPRFNDLSRIVNLQGIGWYLDARFVLTVLGAMLAFGLAIAFGLKDRVIPRDVHMKLQLTKAWPKGHGYIASLTRQMSDAANVLVLKHAEDILSTMLIIAGMLLDTLSNIARRLAQILALHLKNTAVFWEVGKSSATFLLVLYLATYFPTIARGTMLFLVGAAGGWKYLLLDAALVAAAPLIVQFFWRTDINRFFFKATLGIFYLAVMFTFAKWIAFALSSTEATQLAWGTRLDPFMIIFPTALLVVATWNFVRSRREEMEDKRTVD